MDDIITNDIIDDVEGGWWNYRFVARHLSGDSYIITIHEIYYNSDGIIWGWSKEPITLFYESYKDIKLVNSRLRKLKYKNMLVYDVDADKISDSKLSVRKFCKKHNIIK